VIFLCNKKSKQKQTRFLFFVFFLFFGGEKMQPLVQFVAAVLGFLKLFMIV